MSGARGGKRVGGGGEPARPIRVLVADDSPTVRALLASILGEDPSFQIVGEAANGAEAIERAIALAPDLITMDVHMPLVDGIDATKEIMRAAPTPILVVSASVATADVGLALSATQAGALMVLQKPVDPSAPEFEAQAAQLRAMARAMAAVKVVRRWRGAAGEPTVAARGVRAKPAETRAVAIGTSTGGPPALHRLLLDLPRDFPAPILVVQHIAAGFVGGLATWLGANLALRVCVAAEGQALESGTVYLAPDGAHLTATVDARAHMTTTALVNGFRPSADVLFESCARAFGAGTTALILTGMGRDGVDGLRAVHAAGGRVLAQDEASSVVYGMNQEAVRAGVVHEVLPVERLGPRLLELVGRAT